MNTSSMLNIRQRREQLGLSRETLAGLVGVTGSQIYRYEAGVNQPTAEVLSRLADQLGVTVDWLLGRGDSEILNESEKELIDIYRMKEPSRRGALLEMLRIAQ